MTNFPTIDIFLSRYSIIFRLRKINQQENELFLHIFHLTRKLSMDNMSSPMVAFVIHTHLDTIYLTLYSIDTYFDASTIESF